MKWSAGQASWDSERESKRRPEWLSGKWTHVGHCARCEDLLEEACRRARVSREARQTQQISAKTVNPLTQREEGVISDCTYNSKEEERVEEKVGKRRGGELRAHSWRMKTMSLFSLNRIYKPNRHTPTPLTQTHTISFPRCLPPLPAPSLFRQHRRTETQLRRALSKDFISWRKKVRVIARDGEKSWVHTAALGRMDG